ncbi:endoplasmic reticulum vesicle transporter-domain-containing protein [Phlyctochytrium arcticum]|nr:endoplasmic reticulum vesicle transporter-domain-containing protein [Phlyctochytrium arcticum]
MRLASLDAFPKIQRNIQHATLSGGILTLVVAILLAYLATSEFRQYRAIQQDYEFLVDQTRNRDHDLQINLDLTVAMPCQFLRADVLDASGVSLPVSQELQTERVVFEARGARRLGAHQPKGGVNVHNIVKDAMHANPERDYKFEKRDMSNPGAPVPNEGCRIHGSIRVDKVAGMLHFTCPGHGYVGGHTPHEAINFTHRIDRFSFGAYYPGLRNPLDRTLEIANSTMEMFQYFMAIVPTIFLDRARTFGSRILLTNQFAVTDYSRHLSEQAGGNGLPGIFVKYDIEPISVRITESRQTILHFLTRFCGIIGGIFVSAGVALDVVRWMFKRGSMLAGKVQPTNARPL